MDKILGGSVLKTKVIVIIGVTASGKRHSLMLYLILLKMLMYFHSMIIVLMLCHRHHPMLFIKNFNVAVNLFDITQLMKDFFL